MKKIKLFIEASPIAEERVSGIGHMTAEIVRALDNHPLNGKEFEINLVICSDRAHFLEQWGFKNVRIKKIPIPQRLFNIIWKFDLWPPLDILLGKGKGTYIFPNYKNWRLARSRSLTFVCDVSYLVVPEFVSPKNQAFLKKNISKWTRRATRVIAISKNAQSEIIKYLNVPLEKTSLVYCGVDPSVFYPRTAEEIISIKKEYNLPENYILFLSNIEPRKNVINLINAYKQLPPETINKYALLLVGGGGWLDEPIIEAIKQAQNEGYNIVRPVTYIPDIKLPALHSGATVLVHPALYEGFGIAPLQAMACGTPVIVANNSSLPEVVGAAGLLVDANDSTDISVKINELLSNTILQAELSKKGIVQAQKYTWDQSANTLVKEIEG
jgi:glycosyltransferase involved in cell wall biosynthesis